MNQNAIKKVIAERMKKQILEVANKIGQDINTQKKFTQQLMLNKGNFNLVDAKLT